MERIYEELEKNLAQELKIHDSLLAAAHSFNAAIKADDLDAIEKYTRVYDEHVCQIERLEEKRVQLCNDLSENNTLTAKPVKLDKVLDNAPLNLQKRILELRTSLKEKIKLLSRINISNQILIQEAIDLISSTFTIISNAGNRLSPYNGKGKESANMSTQCIINQIA